MSQMARFQFPEGKRYNSSAGYFRKRYGERLQKIVVDAGFTCPNRDGRLSRGGCTYCDNRAFHPSYSTPDKSIAAQIDEGIEFHKVRYRNARHYLAYFQPYSNTYAPLERLKDVYGQALSHPSVRGIVLGTRPDCVDEEKLDYLASLKQGREGFCDGEGNPPVVIVEYGIESCYDRTLKRINRGHDFETARKAVEMTSERGIDCGAHFIFGLPGETREDMLGYAREINSLPLLSAKFHQLQIVKGTAMEREFSEKRGDFVTFGLGEYVDFFIDFLELLRPGIVIERFAGEVPPVYVTDTPWGLVRNADLLHMLDARLEERGVFQGAALQTAFK